MALSAVAVTAGFAPIASPSPAWARAPAPRVPISPVRVHGIVETHAASSTPQDLATLAQIVAGVAAFFSLPFIAWQVYAARANAKLDRTAAVQAVWGAREFRKQLSPVVDFLDVKDEREGILKIRAWWAVQGPEDCSLPRTPGAQRGSSPCTNDVIHVLVFFEDLCQRYNLNEIDRRSVARSLGPVLLVEFVEASWFIHWSRALEQDDLVFREWETAVRHLRGRRRSWSRRAVDRRVYLTLRRERAKFALRVICIPKKDSDDDQWERAVRLSSALSRATALDARLIPAGKRLATVRSAEVGSGWTVVLLPQSLDESPEQCRWNLGLAVALEQRLNMLRPAAIDDAIAELDSGQPVAKALDVSPLMKSQGLWDWRRSGR